MSEFLFRYERVSPASWAYLSSLLTIALYFKFNRLWSFRNVDLIGIICLTPGLLLVQHGAEHVGDPNAALAQQIGYAWLFVTGGLLISRLLMDSTMVRRPLLEPNMTVGGLTFLGVSLFLFLMANVLTGEAVDDAIRGAEHAEKFMRRQREDSAQQTFARYGPGLPQIFLLPHIATRASTKAIYGEDPPAPRRVDTPPDGADDDYWIYEVTTRVMTILAQLMIVGGIVMIGHAQFENAKTGIAAATLYLLIPYTAYRTGDVIAALPAALLVWAIVAYRRPMVAGALLGLAISAVYYPIFLLPLWFSFYWRRGRSRFAFGLLVTILLVVASLAFTSVDVGAFWQQVRAVFGVRFPTMQEESLGGVWQYWHPAYRIPILVVFLAICFSLAFWPAQKNLAVLLSCTAAVMLGTQFWHARTGGIAMAWYLPFVLLTVFRPNLEDRVALNVVEPGPRSRRRYARQLTGLSKSRSSS